MSTPANTPPEQTTKFVDNELSRTLLAEFLGGDLEGKAPEPEQPPVNPEKPAPAPVEEPQQPAPAAVSAEPAPAPEPAPQPAPVKKKAKAPKAEEPKPAAPPTAEEIGTSVARAVAREMRQSQQPPPEVKPVIVVEDDLPPEEVRLQSNLEQLSKLYPKGYGTIHIERKEFVNRLREYEKNWLKDHPGEEFDPNAEEHNDFYAKDPMQKVSSEHLAEAIARRLLEEHKRESEARIQQLEIARQTEPVAASVAVESASGIVKELGEDLAIKVNPNGQIDPASYQAAIEADPIKAPIIAGAAQAAAQLSAEVVKIYNGAVKPDPENNPLHQGFFQFGARMEQKMATLNPADWNDPKGRALEDFLPSRQYWSLPPAQRRNHWTFDKEDMVSLVQADIRNDARASIEAEEKRVNAVISKRGGGVPAAAPKPNSGNHPQRENKPAAPPKLASPSGRGQPNLAGPVGGKLGGDKTPEDAWIAGF